MIDILLATYNGDKYLSQQIESILNQTYQNFRILVRDDASKDNTINVIKRYMKKDPRIVLINDDIKCGSAQSNFMQLIKHADSQYIMFCDQDDVWLKNKLYDSLIEMQKAEKEYGIDTPILVYGKYQVVDENLSPIVIKRNPVDKRKLKLNNLIVQNYVTGCLCMLNKALYKKIGENDNDIIMHDWWVALIASSFGKIVYFDKIVMLYRQHSSNVVGANGSLTFTKMLNKIKDPKTKVLSKASAKQISLLKEKYSNDINQDNLQVIDGYLDLLQQKKLKRITLLIKGKYFKSDIIRIIGQLYYI